MPKRRLEASRLFHALGDPTRLAVIATLCRAPASVSELARPHRLSLPTFLQHLAVLEDSGWIRTHKVGRVRTCELDPAALQRTSDWLQDQRAHWEKRLDQLDDLLVRLSRAKEKP